MISNDYGGVEQTLGKVKKFIKNFDLNLFTKQAKDFHPADIADILEALDDKNLLQAFRKMEPEKSVKVF
ncbi:MAG: hypothetical protein WKG06_11390 [Segetibacter sp.]